MTLIFYLLVLLIFLFNINCMYIEYSLLTLLFLYTQIFSEGFIEIKMTLTQMRRVCKLKSIFGFVSVYM